MIEIIFFFFNYRESRRFRYQGGSYGLKLRGDDGQHGYIDAIKFVEASPYPTLRQAAQRLSYRHVIHTFAAISHDAQ